MTQRFKPPAGVRPGTRCEVLAIMVWPNEVVDVQVQSCTGGGSKLVRAVEKAVLSTRPFPKPPHKAVFDRKLAFGFTVP